MRSKVTRLACYSGQILALLVLASCGRDIPECPKCKVYKGDSTREALVREQDKEYIYANTPEFDKMLGVTEEGMEAFIDTYINGCKEWYKFAGSVKAKKSNVYKRNKKQLKKYFR